MRLICVDDEALVLSLTVSLCEEILPQGTEISSFTRSQDALDWFDGHTADVALLDIDMPGMDGLVLAAKIKEKSPDTAIVFLTGYSQFAVDAFSLHASGYLLKPVSKERLQEEIAFALKGQPSQEAPAPPHIYVQSFGNFDLLVDGQAVTFSRSKAKELLAYLVDRRGSNITRAEASAVLWEDSFYDRSLQKQLDVVIRSLRTTLEESGVGDILEIQRGFMRIRPELIDCDLYRFMEGDINAVNAYRGEYMTAYPWAELTTAYMDRRLRLASGDPDR